MAPRTSHLPFCNKLNISAKACWGSKSLRIVIIAIFLAPHTRTQAGAYSHAPTIPARHQAFGQCLLAPRHIIFTSFCTIQRHPRVLFVWCAIFQATRSVRESFFFFLASLSSFHLISFRAPLLTMTIIPPSSIYANSHLANSMAVFRALTFCQNIFFIRRLTRPTRMEEEEKKKVGK